MKLTIKDLTEIVSYLEVAQRGTARAVEESDPASIYHKVMEEQHQKITALIDRINSMEV